MAQDRHAILTLVVSRLLCLDLERTAFRDGVRLILVGSSVLWTQDAPGGLKSGSCRLIKPFARDGDGRERFFGRLLPRVLG